MPGSASGLRVTAWTSVPDRARAAPARSDATTRGTRVSSTKETVRPARPWAQFTTSPRSSLESPSSTPATTTGDHGDERAGGDEEDGAAPDAQPVDRRGARGVLDLGGQGDQEGAADEAGDDAGGHGDGDVRGDEGAQQHVRTEDEGGAGEARDRQARTGAVEPLGPAREAADERGGAQADEADRSGERDRGRREERGEDDGRDPGGADGDAEAAGRVVAEGQGVDPAGEEEESGEGEERDGRHLQDGVEAALRDAALVPVVEPLRLPREEEEQALGDGGEAEREALPARTRRTVPAPRPERPRTTAAAARPPAKATGGGEERERDAGDGGDAERQVGAGVDREGVGRGDDVAADGLEGGAGHAEDGADEQSGDRPGQPGGDDDGRVGGVGPAGERLQSSAPPTAAVPWVTSTRARPATRRTSAAVTAAAPLRDVTVVGRVEVWLR